MRKVIFSLLGLSIVAAVGFVYATGDSSPWNKNSANTDHSVPSTSGQVAGTQPTTTNTDTSTNANTSTNTDTSTNTNNNQPAAQQPSDANGNQPSGSTSTSTANGSVNSQPASSQQVSNPSDLTVLVNKKHNLPSNYVPPDLVKPNVPFSFKQDIPKRYMRKEAAQALENLFAKAKEDGVELYGVSAYRPYATQVAIFNSNAKAEGKDKANQTSAIPGQSEHQTGLAIDVSSKNMNFLLSEKFGETKEGKWLAEHAADFGFIIRYPKGKESITGYSYEPWHIRYVGVDNAKQIYEKGITLDEYLGDALPKS